MIISKPIELRHVYDDDGIDEALYVDGKLVLHDEFITVPMVFQVLREKLGIDARSFEFNNSKFCDDIEKVDEDEETYPQNFSEMESIIKREDEGTSNFYKGE